MLAYLKQSMAISRDPAEAPSTFDTMFRAYPIAFRIHGMNPNHPRDFTYWWKTLLACFVNFFSQFLLCHSVLFHDIKEGRPNAYQNGFMAVIWFLTMTDYYTVLLNKENLKQMMKYVDEDYARAVHYTPEEQAIIDKYINKSNAISKLWVVISIATAISFPAKSAVIMAYLAIKGEFRLVPFIDLVLPEFISGGNEYLVYVVIAAIEFCYCIFSAATFTIYPPLGPIFTAHACGQIEIQERRIRELYNGTSNEQNVYLKLKEIIKNQQRIFEFIDRLNIIFKVSYDVSLKYSSIGLPLTLFQIKQAVKSNNMSAELIGFLMGNIFHSFIPCLYSDDLEERGTGIIDAIYGCGWEGCFEKRNRKVILIMLLRAQKIPRIESIFQVLCLVAFADMCKSAYTLFNLMTLMWG